MNYCDNPIGHTVEACPGCAQEYVAEAAHWLLVYGPHTTGPFGSDSYSLLSPADVEETENGSLIITTAPRSAVHHPEIAKRSKAKPAERVVYPRGEWTKIRIGPITSARSSS